MEEPKIEAKFVDSNGETQFQLDIKTTIQESKRRNVLGNLLVRDAVQLEQAIRTADKKAIDELYAKLNPFPQSEAPVKEAEIVSPEVQVLPDGKENPEPSLIITP